MMKSEDPPSARSLGRNPFDDDEEEDEATSLSASLDPPSTSLRATTTLLSNSTRSMSELRKTRGALISGHSLKEVQSMELHRNEEISVPESQLNDLESCSPDSDYASRGPSLIPKVIDKDNHMPDATSPIQNLAATVKGRAAKMSMRVPSLNLSSFRSSSYRAPSNTSRLSSSVGKMRYGTNLSPHADDYDDRPGRRKLIVVALVTLSLVLIVAIIVVAIIIFGGANGSGTSSDGTSSSSANASAREKALDNILVRVSGQETLLDPTSPQAKARHWLLYEDELWVHPAQAIPGERVIQRYILLVLYFATGGQTTWGDNNWLDGNECNSANGEGWTGLACNDDDEVLTIAFGTYWRHCDK
jgi:hypothetical protein